VIAEPAFETLSPSTARAHAALQEALDCRVELWDRQDVHKWRQVMLNDAEGDRDDDGMGLFDVTVAALLELAHATTRTHRAALTPERDVIAAPLLEYTGDARLIAVAVVENVHGPYAQRLTDLVLSDLQQQKESEWLRDENYVFSQQVTDDFEELTFLRTMATHLVVNDTSLDIHQIVEKTLSGLREMIGAETIFFVNPGDVGLHVMQSCCSHPEEAVQVEVAVLAKLAEAYRERSADGPYVNNDLRTTNPEAGAAGIRQFLMVPINTAARRFGWFVAVNRTTAGRSWAPSPLLQIGQDEFGTWEASLLSTAASLVASHASNLELLREQEHLLINTVRSLVSALDAKDTYTRGHSERVALFSQRIAETMGYDSAARDRLYLSGLLHDVGKIGVSDATLRKPDKLTVEEFAEIKRHPDEGWAILRDLAQLRYVLPGVLHHHEQINGSGYPDGLKGEEIPLDARIMAVADAYDAMTSDRAYREGMPHVKAIDILRAGAGTQWDAEVVATFLKVVDDITAIRYGYKPYERAVRSGPALAPGCRS